MTPENLRKQSPEYKAWAGMKSRCGARTGSKYKYYKQKGINYSKRWRVFANFLLDMAPKPSPKHSLDRLNSAKNYCKRNCRWATAAEQGRSSARCKTASVLKIKRMYASGKYSQYELAMLFGISHQHISRLTKSASSAK